MRQIIFILTLSTLFGCGQTETKKVVSTYFNGNPEVLYYFPKIDDTLTYRKEVFYETGKQKYIGHILNGTKNGIWTWWYENGNKKDQCKYENGYYVDTVYHWYETGQLKQIEIIAERTVTTDGCCNCNGTIIRFYENGRPKEMFTNINNIQQDTAKTWYENGRLEWFTIFKNGKEEGLSETYYENGKLEKSGFLLNDSLEGNLTHWDSLGNIISVTKYKAGKIINGK